MHGTCRRLFLRAVILRFVGKRSCLAFLVTLQLYSAVFYLAVISNVMFTCDSNISRTTSNDRTEKELTSKIIIHQGCFIINTQQEPSHVEK